MLNVQAISTGMSDDLYQKTACLPNAKSKLLVVCVCMRLYIRIPQIRTNKVLIKGASSFQCLILPYTKCYVHNVMYMYMALSKYDI